MRCNRALIAAAVSEFGQVDILVANAGQGALFPVRDMQEQDIGVFSDLMNVNYIGSVYPTFFALPHLRKSKGIIVVNSSVAGIAWTPARTAYSASKHALRGFYNSLRTEEPDIQITTVYPGFVYSEIHDNARTANNKKLERQESHFMKTDVACRLILEGVRGGARDYPLTWEGSFAQILCPLMPGILDKMAARQARAGVKNWE
jgi:NAD(P)-dependent dehydrogenase (short-subunit alcohol dehydrogenase family)